MNCAILKLENNEISRHRSKNVIELGRGLSMITHNRYTSRICRGSVGSMGRWHFLAVGFLVLTAAPVFAAPDGALPAIASGPTNVQGIDIPTPKMPQPNAWDFYLKAAESEFKADDSPLDYALQTGQPIEIKTAMGVVTRPVTENDKDVYLRRREEALRIFREGLRYEARKPAVRGDDIPFIGHSQMRELGRMLMVVSRLQGERGDWVGAATTSLDIFQLGRDITYGGITNLLAGSVQSMGRKPLRAALEHLDAAQSQAAARRLEEIMTRGPSYAEVLEEEKWVVLSMMEYSMQTPEWRKMRAATPAAKLDFKALGFKNDKELKQLRAVSDQQIASNYVAYMDAHIANARLPRGTAKTVPAIPNDPLNKSANRPGLHEKVWTTAEIRKAHNALLVATLALRSYKLEKGEYPATLEAFAPQYLKAPPADPFSGATLRYRREGDKYLLYSIGPDGKDDAGKPIFDASRKANRHVAWPDSIGDIVAGANDS